LETELASIIQYKCNYLFHINVVKFRILFNFFLSTSQKDDCVLVKSLLL